MEPKLLLELRAGSQPTVHQQGLPYSLLQSGAPAQPTSDEAVRIEWDSARGRLTVQASVYGAYPLYFAQVGTAFLLSSQVAELYRYPRVPRGFDARSVARALCGLPLGQSTLFSSIRQLPPEHEAIIDQQHLMIRPLPPAKPLRPPEARWDLDEATSEELEKRLIQALAERVESGGTLFTLSGGLDTSLLLALAVSAKMPVTALTLTGGPETEELERARLLCRQWGIRQREIAVSEAELPSGLGASVTSSEALLWNGRATAKYLLFQRLGAPLGTRLLSGAGADEVFLGNPHLFLAPVGQLPLWSQQQKQDVTLARSVLRPEVLPLELQTDFYPDTPSLREGHAYLLNEVLPLSTLPSECRLGARCGLDVRLPFLDRRVTELALSVAPELELQQGRGKQLLRLLARKFLPDEVVNSQKRPILAPPGGSTPLVRNRWLQAYRAWLSTEMLRPLDFLDHRAVQAMLQAFSRMADHDPRRPAYDRLLLRVCSLSILHHRLINDLAPYRRSITPPPSIR